MNAEPGTSNAYKFRMAWNAGQFGKPAEEYVRMMEDGKTVLRISEFPPQTHNGRKREYWTYVSNGMAERRMPWEIGPKGNAKKRIELMIYAATKSDATLEVLHELAKFPFSKRTRLDRYHTMPFSHRQLDWAGLILLEPPCETMGADTQSAYPEETDDVTFLLQVAGLKNEELEYAVKHGGKIFVEETIDRVKAQTNLWTMLLFDMPRQQFPMRKKG